MTKAATPLETLNSSREETITKHYNAAFAELQEKIQKEPLRSSFQISAGCIDKDIANEIARRFERGNIKAEYRCGGFFFTHHYLNVEVSLPEHLVPKPQTVEINTVNSEVITL